MERPGTARDRVAPPLPLAVADARPTADNLAAFRPLIQAIRWGTLAVGFALAGPRDERALAWGAVLAIYALFRTFRPLAYRSDRLSDMVAVVAEVALCGVVVIATGYWSSPFFFCLATAIAAAGFARGFAFAIRTACATVVAVALPYHVGEAHATLQQTLAWGSELVMIALVTGYARLLFGEAEARTSEALDRITQLSSANDLLFQLHRLAQTLPASLDLGDAIESAARRLRELVDPDVIGVLVRDDARDTWSPAFLEGGRLAAVLTDQDLPGPLRRSCSAARSLWVS